MIRPSWPPFARGLASFAMAALGVLGFVAFFLTGYGDCLSTQCWSPAGSDLAIYALDVAAILVLGWLRRASAPRPGRVATALLVAIGTGFALQGAASLLGARGFWAFGILLPASVLLLIATAIAARPGLADRAAALSQGDGEAVGVAVHVGAFAVPFGIGSVFAGSPIGVALAVAVLALLVVGTEVRRRRSRRLRPDTV